MSNLTTGKGNHKSQTHFQKMWQRVEHLKADIARRDSDLDTLAEHLRGDFFPRVCAAAKANVELIYRLVDLGQRKSWTNWQRQEIEFWIKENMQVVAGAGLLDNALRDQIARYDAFRLGIELDENDGRSPGEQLDDLINQQAKQYAQEQEDAFADIKNDREAMIETALDREFGLRPADNATERQKAYDQKREQRRLELNEEFQNMFDKIMDDDFDEKLDDSDEFHFDPGELDKEFESKDARFKLDNATLQRLFRSTAAVLHPDRELDPDKRLLKQSLMAQLSAARKSGDVMTLLSLYQEHVENSEALSKSDEEQLIKALAEQVQELEAALAHYEPSSALHAMALDLYSPCNKTLQENIEDRLEAIEGHAQMTRQEARALRSMKALKPRLELRYEMRQESLYRPFEFVD